MDQICADFHRTAVSLLHSPSSLYELLRECGHSRHGSSVLAFTIIKPSDAFGQYCFFARSYFGPGVQSQTNFQAFPALVHHHHRLLEYVGRRIASKGATDTSREDWWLGSEIEMAWNDKHSKLLA